MAKLNKKSQLYGRVCVIPTVRQSSVWILVRSENFRLTTAWQNSLYVLWMKNICLHNNIQYQYSSLGTYIDAMSCYEKLPVLTESFFVEYHFTMKPLRACLAIKSDKKLFGCIFDSRWSYRIFQICLDTATHCCWPCRTTMNNMGCFLVYALGNPSHVQAGKWLPFLWRWPCSLVVKARPVSLKHCHEMRLKKAN